MNEACRTSYLIGLFALGLLGPVHAACAQDEPALARIAAAGRRTLSRLEQDPASWTTAFEFSGGV